jgi:hypothetical protein
MDINLFTIEWFVKEYQKENGDNPQGTIILTEDHHEPFCVPELF